MWFAALLQNRLVIEPNELTPETYVMVTADVTLNETVTEGSIVYITMTVDNYPFKKNEFSFCYLLTYAQLNVTCPLQAQKYQISKSILVNGGPASGDVNVLANIVDQNGHQLACINMNVNHPPPT